MPDSHTPCQAGADLRLLPGLGLADLSGGVLPERLAGKVSDELERFAEHMRHGLLSAAISIGLETLGELLEAEVTDLAGPKGRHQPDRTHVRHGREDAKVSVGGRRVEFARPRVRRVGTDGEGAGEVVLKTWDALGRVDLLAEHTVAAMLAGVSTRAYETVLEPVGPVVEAASSSTSKSAVSRRFVTATKDKLAEFRCRPLGGHRFLIVFIDGFGFGDETMVGALGVTADGTKMPLSVTHGSTENKTVVGRLFDNLDDRGFDPSAGVLFVIDGGKALSAAIKDRYGDVALIQRCRAHKSRNVTDLLPESHRPWVRRALTAAWNQPDVAEAEKALRQLAAKLERTHPDAAASLREGLVETISINRLGVTGTLARTLATTNPMESTVDIIRTHARNVKRWTPGDMRLRWAAAGMLAAEAQYRRVKGYRQLDHLARAITNIITTRQLAHAS